ncbi:MULTISPECIES: MBL fold metallo-hydrolase [unclassified Burkholderia]|uniref:MBL fold metallo-hydrolase n=1 Tax=unclassified Burkholderia TaxID=2613784 RepID=UPI000F5B0CBB|nr:MULTISPECIES: MBL fold metallo-hydrolase [unclassified Burkholderia]RQR32500.1 MBL fold metallo-hydrolase [Burkholderia sp. Bp9131]RQR67072.1 MBL fold metallo-hydrolase [Burkholderia sp. Bp9015]
MSDWYHAEKIDDELTVYTEPNVHRFFRANIFHLRGRQSDLVVDFGMGIQPLMPHLTIDHGKKIIAVATHIHADHVGAFYEFETRVGHRNEATAFASMGDEDTVADIFRALENPVTRVPYDGWQAVDYQIKPAPLTHVVDQGDHIDIGGWDFEVIHFPGHSHGSIALFDRNRKVMFSGDVIYDGGLVDDLPCSCKSLYRDTMHRLLDMDLDIVYGGHGATMTGERMKKIASIYLAK